VTSFAEQHVELYAKEFLRTFKKFWHPSINLVVYYEGFEPQEGWRHIEEVEHLSAFMENISAFPLMSGYVPTRGGETRYRIGLDARMCRKVFIQNHAVKQFKGKVFWLDADSITHAPVTPEFLESVLPDDKMNCYLGRDRMHQGGPQYTESGFIGFNHDHPMCSDFMNAYVNICLSGAIFTRAGWHDCYAFDAARETLGHPEFFNNLAGGLPDDCSHPFVNSVLGSVMDHKKGPRKHGRSEQKDLVVERTEPYWNDKKIVVSGARISA
jgi:hypothetical protein